MLETTTPPTSFNPALENGVAFRLQHCLVELIDLGLHAKQAQWNVVGTDVRSLRARFAEVSDKARAKADGVAGRLATLQVSPHGTLAAVCESPLEPFPVGWLPGPKAVAAILARIDHLSRTNALRIKEIRGIDRVSEAILIDLADELDSAAWMLRKES